MSIDDETLQRWREAAEAATPGPWMANRSYDCVHTRSAAPLKVVCRYGNAGPPVPALTEAHRDAAHWCGVLARVEAETARMRTERDEALAEVERFRAKLAGLDNDLRLAAGEMRDDGYISEDDLECILSVVDAVLP